MSLILPTTEAQALEMKAQDGAEFRAGGTDVIDRLRRGIAAPTSLVSLHSLKSLQGFTEEADGLIIGANETLHSVSVHPLVRRFMPVVADACAHTATPQIRQHATVGGALAQRVRCPYFRQPDFTCAKKGGPFCFARTGEHTYHGVFDNAVCMSLQPSTLALALVTIDAEVEVIAHGGKATWKPLRDVVDAPIGDATKDNGLGPAELIRRVRLPLHARWPQQRYERLSARELADWPLVEVAVVASMLGGVIDEVRIGLGAVGRNIRRATRAEGKLKGMAPSTANLKAAADLAVEGAAPGLMNQDKLLWVQRCVHAALEGAFA